MTTAIEKLTSRMYDADPFDYRLDDVRALQLQAADERFQLMRRQMPILERRADESGTERIEKLSDIKELFISDDTYKSYPESLIEQRNWKALGAWAQATSAGAKITEVDVEGVQDIDEWLQRMRDANIFFYVSSGTSGKVSIFHASPKDRDSDLEMFKLVFRWCAGAIPNHDRPVFALFPEHGPLRQMDSFGRVARAFGSPETVYYLSDDPLRATEMNALGRLRKAVAAGTAKPAEISAFEQETAAKQVERQLGLERLAEALVRHRHQPSLVIGTWAPEYLLTKAAIERGLDSGIHPDSMIVAGGGLKGISVPPDFREFIQKGLGLADSRYVLLYGMSELSSNSPACAHRRYHVVPWMIPMVLDKEGDNLLEFENGQATGRLAFFDLLVEGRWGALITGDQGTIDTNPCPCGRSGPTIHDTVKRYADLPGGDDRVSCAGTIDSYLRGSLAGTPTT